jgi:fructokinase
MSDPRVLVAGEALVDFIPDTPGRLADVERFERRAGGAPANVAVGLARLDETPWLCTTLSTDPFGDFLAETLASEGLSDEYVERVDHPTALAFVSHDADADRGFSFHRENTADVNFATAHVDGAALETVDYLVVGGVTLSVEPARSATFELVERARDAGCRVVFDPNTRPELWDDDPMATFDRLLPLVDVVKASSEDFAAADVPDEGGEFGRWLLERGPDVVLLTAGEAGARAVAAADSPWGAGEWHHPGYDAEGVVDTTGAGDAFLAGVVAAMVDGAAPEETLGFANAVAAVSTTDRGAMTALPDAAAVERLREREP